MPQTVGFSSREINVTLGCPPVLILGLTDKFVSFASSRLRTLNKLAGHASIIQGISNPNQTKYYGPENKLSCLKHKGNSFDGKKHCFRLAKNDFLSILL